MKKTFRAFGAVLMCMLLAISFTSCGDDDDEPGDGLERDSNLIGSWGANFNYPDGDTEVVVISFGADGTYSFTFTLTEPDGTTDVEWEKGVWYTTNNNTKLGCSVTASDDPEDVGDTYIESYSISGNILTLDNDFYTRL